MDNQDQFISYLKERGNSKSTISSYLHHHDAFAQWAESHHIEIEYATYSELLDYIAHLRKRNLHQHTIRGYLTAITHYFETLVKAETILQNPARPIKLKGTQTCKPYPILSKTQLENLYHHLDTTTLRKTRPSAKASALRNRIAIGLMIYQGLDTSALSGIKTKDLDILKGKIHITSSRKHQARTLPLQAVQIIELDRYITQTRKELQHHFNQENSDRLLITGFTHYRDSLRNLMKQLRKQEPQLESTHHIRASVITHWLKQYNLREVQYMVGHKHVLSTEMYQQNDTEGLQQDIDRFHPMNQTH